MDFPKYASKKDVGKYDKIATTGKKPYKNTVTNNGKYNAAIKSKSTSSKDGKWVTVNGKHMFIEDK